MPSANSATVLELRRDRVDLQARLVFMVATASIVLAAARNLNPIAGRPSAILQ